MVTAENFDRQVLSLDSLKKERKKKQPSITNLVSSTTNNRRIKKQKSQTITQIVCSHGSTNTLY
jgi:hypothetical protein